MNFPSERCNGACLGVFVGDALGTTLEFEPKPRALKNAKPWHTKIVGGGPFGLEPRDWTDDGAMTLCLARALAEDEPPAMDVRRQLDHFLRWRDEGWCSSNGRCFDIGGQTSGALRHYADIGCTTAPEDPGGQGNGGLMRAVPVPIWLTRWRHELAERERLDPAAATLSLPGDPPDSASADIDPFRIRAGLYSAASATTHNSAVCRIAAVIYSEMVFHALLGRSRDLMLEMAAQLVDGVLHRYPEFVLVFAALCKPMRWEDFEPTGWAVHSLGIACWALRTHDNFHEGMVDVVNMRGDADTNGAIYGGLAGAVFGSEGIPERWLNALKHRDWLDEALRGLLGPGTASSDA